MKQHARIAFFWWWELPHLNGQPKHPYKVHVWAGISQRGATHVAIFAGIMVAEFFVHGVLKEHLLPFIDQKFPDSYRFMQDSDPKHIGRLAKEYYEEAGINW